MMHLYWVSGLNLNVIVILKAKAINNKDDQDIVIMKFVNAYFYFKDDTFVQVKSTGNSQYT